MAASSDPLYLTDKQKRDTCAVLMVGCDRETAANYANCTLADFRRQLVYDREFAAEVRRAEAASEVTHMRNVQSAASDVKNWRASVWWLERRAPERYGRRDAGALTPGELKSFMAILVTMVIDEVRHADDLRRLLARFDEAIRSLQEAAVGEVASADQLRLPAPPDAEDESTTAEGAIDAEFNDETV
jgi:hypothetical protein